MAKNKGGSTKQEVGSSNPTAFLDFLMAKIQQGKKFRVKINIDRIERADAVVVVNALLTLLAFPSLMLLSILQI